MKVREYLIKYQEENESTRDADLDMELFAKAYLAHRIEEAEKANPASLLVYSDLDTDEKIWSQGYKAALNKLKEG